MSGLTRNLVTKPIASIKRKLFPKGETTTPEYNAILEVLKKHQEPNEKIYIITDNVIVVKSLTSYYKNWIENGWLTAKGQPVKDADVMEKILELYAPEYIYVGDMKKRMDDDFGSPLYEETIAKLTEKYPAPGIITGRSSSSGTTRTVPLRAAQPVAPAVTMSRTRAIAPRSIETTVSNQLSKLAIGK